MVSFGWVKPFYETTRKNAEGFTCVKQNRTIDFDKNWSYYGY
jgi:hypothetical protein